MSRSKRPTKGAAAKRGGNDLSRWAHAIFAVGGFLAIWMTSHLVEDVWALLQSIWTQIPRPDGFRSNALGIVLGLGITVWAWRTEKYFTFVSEVVDEVAQVTWPTRAETRAATVVVITITLVCSGLLFGMDVFWKTVTDFLYGL